MTYPPPPHDPNQPPVTPGYGQPAPHGYPVMTPPPVKKSKTRLILAIVGGVLVLCCGGGVIAAINGDSKPDAKKDPNSIAAPEATAAAGAETADQPAEPVVEPKAEYTPKAGDFKLKVKVLDKQCFGSAGCNVTYRVVPVYTGDSFSSDREAEVTYEVHGLEDTATSTFTMDGTGSANLNSEETGSTTSSGKKLTAKVVDVETS
jgi:hypothetical protein